MSTEYVERSTWHRRAVGRWGSVARVLVGASLIALAFAYWRAGWLDVLIGVVALPAVTIGGEGIGRILAHVRRELRRHREDAEV
jgi:hypothetical protein